MKEKSKVSHLAIELAVLLAALVMLLYPSEGGLYRRYVTDTLRYVRAVVLEVESETLSDSELKTGQKLGEQRLRVRLSDGQEIILVNYLTEIHNILLKKGDSAYAPTCPKMPSHTTPYITTTARSPLRC